MPIARSVVAGIIVVAWPLLASAYPMDWPLESICMDSDLIVVGKIVHVGEPTKLELELSGYEIMRTGTWFKACAIDVSEVIKTPRSGDTGKAEPNAKKKLKRITAFIRSGDPSVKGSLWYENFCNVRYPELPLDGERVFILQRLPGRKEYYLPAHTKYYRSAKKTWVAAVKKAVDVAAFPWGKPVKGLQISVTLPVEDSGDHSTSHSLVVAVRNASNRPIRLNMHAPDKFLSVRATGPDGKAITVNWTFRPPSERGAFKKADTQTVQPGQIMFLGPWGPQVVGASCWFPRQSGAWRLQVVYRSERRAEGMNLWTGRAESKPVAITVPPAPKKPPPATKEKVPSSNAKKESPQASSP